MAKKIFLSMLLCLFALSFGSCESEKEKTLSQIRKIIEITNKDCPTRVDEITVWTNTDVDENNLIYYYTLDEDQLSEDAVEVLEENKSELKSAIGEGLKSDDQFIQQLVTLLTKADLGIQFHYTTSESGQSFDIFFTPEEIAAFK